MTLPLPRKVGVPLVEPLITSPPGHEAAGRTKPQLALGSPVSSARPQLYSASSPRCVNRPGLPIYSRFTSRPSRWKSRRAAMRTRISGPGPKGGIDRLEDTVKEVTNWDGLSMDPEMWYPDGNCLVHLYARGSTASSTSGPAFLIPLEFLVGLDCIPLLDRFLAGSTGNPPSNREFVKGRSSLEYTAGRYDLYMPPPPTAEGEQKLLCRTGMRNFFAWICGKPLVGESLGQALVGLLNSMSEYRGLNVDNVEDILDYMEEGGYADLGGSPVHTLATLHFAEHFQFENLYTDAFAHAVGMHDEVILSPEYKCISTTTRSLLTHAHTELHNRLTHTSTSLSTFLTDELSPTHLDLTPASRTHLDRFRAFLTTYWTITLGSYPPSSAIFPNQVLLRIRTEFKDLYAYLVDESFTASDCSPAAAQGGVCVLQSVQAFDARLGYESFLHPLPLLPTSTTSRPVNARTHSLRSPTLARTFSWSRPSSPKADSRLLALSTVAKASNHHKHSLLDAPLVKAYREFETESILSAKEDKRTRVSAAAARKVRWILIYATLQTLRSATDILPAVRTPLTVPYHLSAKLPRLPWQPSFPRPSLTPSRTQTLHLSLSSTSIPSSPSTPHTPPSPIEPDIDHTLLTRPASSSPSLALRPRRASLPTLARSLSSAASLGRAISVMSRHPTRRSSAPTPSRTPSTGLENSFTSAAEADEDDQHDDDGGMEIGCWAKQVELNQISPSSPSSSSGYSDETAMTPASPLSRIQSSGGYDFDTAATATPPSPLSQAHSPFEFEGYKIENGGVGEMERRWSGSTAHEEVGPTAVMEAGRGEGRMNGGGMRELGLAVGALGALLDGVVEERVFFEIEDFPGSGGGGGGGFEGERRVGMAM